MYVGFAKQITGSQVLRLHSDHGTEFQNELMTNYCTSSGIVQECSNVYTPRQNGNAERINLTFWNMTRTMLLATELPRQLWGDVHTHVVYLYNHRPHDAINSFTAAELFYAKDDARRAIELQ